MSIKNCFYGTREEKRKKEKTQIVTVRVLQMHMKFLNTEKVKVFNFFLNLEQKLGMVRSNERSEENEWYNIDDDRYIQILIISW